MGRDLMTSEQKSRIQELAIKAIDGDLLPAESRELEGYIASSAVLADYYSTCIKMHLSILEAEASCRLAQRADTPVLDRELWQTMALHEKTAPEIEPVCELPPRELIRKVEYVKAPSHVNKLRLAVALFSAAALLFLIAFIQLANVPAGQEVVTLTDSIDAQWAEADASMIQGVRLAVSSKSLFLQEGIAEMTFDNGARVLIEAPSEFRILAEDRIGLRYGRSYAIVPRQAVGFSIYTDNAKVIDLGTEFGVEVDSRGDTTLYVIKGQTRLIAGKESDTLSIEVDHGTAKKVAGSTQRITDIPCTTDLFVRDIDSQVGAIWRGNNISLASLAAGLDGFQVVGSLIGLDPVNGEFVTSVEQQWRRVGTAYRHLSDLKFIDGVFVPDGQTGVIQITSLGHTFNCPDTLGVFTHDIAVYQGPVESLKTTIPPVVINGEEVVHEPILMLHSNIGITFDLQALRETLPPPLVLKRLEATGMTLEKYDPDLEFLVLVDGQIRYERAIKTTDSDRGPIPFQVDLGPEDRFLTLIVIDGPSNTYANDFFYLIKPELFLAGSDSR